MVRPQDKETFLRLHAYTDVFIQVLRDKGWVKEAYYETIEPHPFSPWGFKLFVLPKDKKVESKVDAMCLSYAREVCAEVDVESEVSYERLTGGTFVVVELLPVS